jgi:oxidoreductase
LLVSSMGSDPKSWFLYPRTKGEVEAELGQKKLNLLTVMRPGLLRDRREARTIEKALSWLPFVPGINAHDAA